jgi:glutathione S-transferase
MKLYYHPVSTTSRPIVLFAADAGIALDYQVVDLFTGEHMQPAFAAINPSQQVPVLEDGDFRLTECSAILRYLAEKIGSPAYPTDIRRRARVNERMDWLNTGLARDLLYGFCYPQSLAHHKRQDDATHTNTIAWGRQNARRWLGILDEQLIGPDNAYLCGDEITLADYLGAGILSHGEVEQIDYAHWRNITRWLDTMKARPNWAKVQEPFQQYWVTPCANNRYEVL